MLRKALNYGAKIAILSLSRNFDFFLLGISGYYGDMRCIVVTMRCRFDFRE